LAILCALWNKPPDLFAIIKNTLNDGMFRVVSTKSVRAVKMAKAILFRNSKSLGHLQNNASGIFEYKISKVAVSAPKDPITLAAARECYADVGFASLNPVRPINYLTTRQILNDLLLPEWVLPWRTVSTRSKM
jgi:hypothetical protein